MCLQKSLKYLLILDLVCGTFRGERPLKFEGKGVGCSPRDLPLAVGSQGQGLSLSLIVTPTLMMVSDTKLFHNVVKWLKATTLLGILFCCTHSLVILGVKMLTGIIEHCILFPVLD